MSGSQRRSPLCVRTAVSGSGMLDVDVQRAGRGAAHEPLERVADRAVALALDVRRLAERAGRVDARADERRAGGARGIAQAPDRARALARGRHHRRRQLDHRGVEVGLQRAVATRIGRRQHVVEHRGEHVLGRVDEQELLLDAEREWRRAAEPVLGRQRGKRPRASDARYPSPKP